MRYLWMFLSLCLLVALVVTGCGEAQPTEAPVAAPTEVDPTVAPSVEEPASELSGKISNAGSTTVQPLAEKWAETFEALYPDVSIDVQGGGSSVGVKSAAEGTVEVGSASRKVKDSEMADYPDLKVFTVAKDGIAVAVHPDVAVDDISMDQIQQVFSGEITNFSEIGGPDAPITVISREEGSGTRDAFEEITMGDAVIVDTAILLPSNGAVRTTVSTTPNSIAYLSLGYLDQTVKALTVDGMEATTAAVLDGSYPVQRPLNMVTLGEPNDLAQAWLDYIMTDEGQAVVVEEGFIPLS